MTERKVEAGDRALETARKCVEIAQGYASDAGILDSIELEGRIAAEVQSAMNAQERELRHAVDCMDRGCKRCNELSRGLAERGGTQ